ncbi:MAG: hypothetical protein V3T65_06875 [Acidobacteriota bacterium]
MADYPRHPSGRLPFPWEIPSRPGGGVSPLADEPGPNPVVNTPNWLRDALALKGDEVPSNLWLPNIQPTLEAFQDGWGIARYFVGVDGDGIAGRLTAAAPNQVLLTADTAVHRRIIEIDAEHDAAGNITLTLFATFFSVPPIAITVVTVPTATVLGTVQLLDGHPLIVPPRFGLSGVAVGLAGVEVLAVNFSFVEVPTGFHAPAY